MLPVPRGKVFQNPGEGEGSALAMFMWVGWPAGPSCPDRQLLPPLSPRALCTSVIWVCRSQEEPPLDPLPGQFRPLFRLSLNIPPFTSGCHRTPSSAAVISRVRGHTQRPFGVQEDLRTLYIYFIFFLKKKERNYPFLKLNMQVGRGPCAYNVLKYIGLHV